MESAKSVPTALADSVSKSGTYMQSLLAVQDLHAEFASKSRTDLTESASKSGPNWL